MANVIQYVITPQEMYAAERAVFAAGRGSFELMQEAGQGVADLIQKRYPTGDVRVLCGPGGNGGDGVIAATQLKAAGRSVSVFLLGSIHALQGDTRRALEMWSGGVETLEAAIKNTAEITVDALFGGGLSRPLEGICHQLASATRAPTISIDVPSGLDGLSGRPLGACFRAATTVTFAALRPAHVLSPGKRYCGEVQVIDIGVPVPQHTVYRSILIAQQKNATLLSGETAVNALLDRVGAIPSNRIDRARIIAKQSGRSVLFETPDRILALPSGEVVIEPDQHRSAI